MRVIYPNYILYKIKELKLIDRMQKEYQRDHTLMIVRAPSSVHDPICLFVMKFIRSWVDHVAADFEVSTPVPFEMMLDAAIASNIRFFWTATLVGCKKFSPPFLLAMPGAMEK